MEDVLKNSLEQLLFDNRFVTSLPADPERINRRRTVKNACYSFVDPTTVTSPSLVAWSREMLSELGLDEQVCQASDFSQVFAGNKVLQGMQPHAMCYGGHQFGHWAGQLGDGRAIILGDVKNAQDQYWSLQLKGAGPTPYSRTADGLAVLRSSLREFLCSEAMYHLGVPTTRALSLVLTGESVVRDMFYDGHPQHEPGAVVCRMAPSFIRFGNYQILTAQGDITTLRQLVDFTIETEFTELGKPCKEVYSAWFRQVCKLTAEMIVHWMRVGFVHGVMNTDNMSILGLTIDYGPYGWLEDYDPDWTPNTTDAQGKRYRFGAQPQVAQWNLLQLAEAIYPLIEEVEPLEEALQYYADYYQQQSQIMLAQKLGFAEASKESSKLSSELDKLLKMVETDMTLFYRDLAQLDLQPAGEFKEDALRQVFENSWYQHAQINHEYLQKLQAWLSLYRRSIQAAGISELKRTEQMNQVNPKYVLRNYLAQMAIDKVEQGDASLLNEMLEVFRKPYDEQPGKEQFSEKRPEWARHRAGCSMLSCSS